MARRNADRLIAAADAIENLRPIGLTPANEAQARPLTALQPQLRKVELINARWFAPGCIHLTDVGQSRFLARMS